MRRVFLAFYRAQLVPQRAPTVSPARKFDGSCENLTLYGFAHATLSKYYLITFIIHFLPLDAWFPLAFIAGFL